MKVLVFLAASLLAGGVITSPVDEYGDLPEGVEPRGIADVVNSTLNGIVANLTDTIEVKSLPIDFGTGETLSGPLNITNLKLNGLKSLVATKITVNVLSLKFDVIVHLTELLLSFKYYADLLLLQLVPLYGDGTMTFTFDDIVLEVSGKASIGDEVNVKNLTVGVALGDSVFDFTGLIDSPELSSIVSNALNDNFAKFVDDNHVLVSKIISPIIETVVNSFLKNSTSIDLEELDEIRSQYIKNNVYALE